MIDYLVDDPGVTIWADFNLWAAKSQKWLMDNARCLSCEIVDLQSIPCCDKPVMFIDASLRDECESIIQLEKKRGYRRRSYSERIRRYNKAEGFYQKSDIDQIYNIQNGNCYFCRASLGNKDFEIDHFIPLSLGGSNWPSNLRLSCRDCNVRKGGKEARHWFSALSKERGTEFVKNIKRENKKKDIEISNLDASRIRDLEEIYDINDLSSPYSFIVRVISSQDIEEGCYFRGDVRHNFLLFCSIHANKICKESFSKRPSQFSKSQMLASCIIQIIFCEALHNIFDNYYKGCKDFERRLDYSSVVDDCIHYLPSRQFKSAYWGRNARRSVFEAAEEILFEEGQNIDDEITHLLKGCESWFEKRTDSDWQHVLAAFDTIYQKLRLPQPNA